MRAVDGGGGGILQDLHGFDHGRIQVIDLIDLQAVHDQERAEAGTGVGGDTADADGRAFARRTGVVEDLHARGLALEGGGCVRGGTIHQFLGTDGSHRTGEVALALDAVADDHGFFEEFGVFPEDDVNDGLVGDGNHLRSIADAGEFEIRAGGHVQAVGAVRVGHRSHGAVTDKHDRRADDGRALDIYYRSPDYLVLRGG